MQTAPFVDLSVHHTPADFSDRVALGFTKAMRFCADTFFAKRYGHRAIVLETVAAVPGMVGATLTHLKCLRRMCDDQGWIRTLMEEAENEGAEPTKAGCTGVAGLPMGKHKAGLLAHLRQCDPTSLCYKRKARTGRIL